MANDTRAVIIATATNLLRRQELTIIEQGKAYKAILEAKRRQGERMDLGTSGENRQKFLSLSKNASSRYARAGVLVVSKKK